MTPLPVASADGSKPVPSSDVVEGAPDETTFTLLWSADGGQTWIPAAVDVTGNEITIPTSARFPAR